jgi:hypothetical protein
VNAARDSLNRTATLPRAGALRFLAADWLVDRFWLGLNAAAWQDLPPSMHQAVVNIRIDPLMRLTGAARDVSHLALRRGEKNRSSAFHRTQIDLTIEFALQFTMVASANT